MGHPKILIICGEPSGDLNAANLAKAILATDPGVKISGVGGALLTQAGAEIFYDIKGLSSMGFFDVLLKLPKFLSLKKLILEKIKIEKPDAVIFVDFSGFNLRLAKSINKTIRTIYYISPQVWASRPGRIKTIKKYIDKMIVLFKFEEEFYKKHGIDVEYVAHPLLDIAQPTQAKLEFFAEFFLPLSKTTIALLPGSRKSEIENILTTMLQASVLIGRGLNNVQFIIAKSPQVDWALYNRKIAGVKVDLRIIEAKTYDCLAAADFALVCSGTATLETAIIGTPFVVVYKMGLLNYLLYRPQVKVPFIGMVNIVAGKKIIPEFIQFKAQPEKIANAVLKILKKTSEIARIRNDLAQVKSSLGDKGASLRAASIILDFLK